MKPLLLPLLLTLTTVASGEPSAKSPLLPSRAPALIQLRDQFDAPQTLSFPATNIIVLTIADKKGSEQIDAWVAAIKKQFGQRIEIRGIADVSSVPRWLREMVRKRFQKVQTHPVMMDWSGETVKAITYVPGVANVLVLDKRGQILKRLIGAANDKSIQDLRAAIDLALSGPVEKSAGP